jgi:hypothetical protein
VKFKTDCLSMHRKEGQILNDKVAGPVNDAAAGMTQSVKTYIRPLDIVPCVAPIGGVGVKQKLLHVGQPPCCLITVMFRVEYRGQEALPGGGANPQIRTSEVPREVALSPMNQRMQSFGT